MSAIVCSSNHILLENVQKCCAQDFLLCRSQQKCSALHADSETHHDLAQAIYQDDAGNGSEVGAVARRTKDKGQDYGDWWGARSTGSMPQVDELTWFIRWAATPEKFTTSDRCVRPQRG